MAENLQVYKCEVCGNIITVLHAGVGQLVCCKEPMVLYQENTVDAAREKHIPVLEKIDGAVKVKIGSIPHPMEEKHYIEWIELLADSKSYRQFLEPGDTPQAIFTVEASQVTARAYCNIHGLWKE